MASKQNKWFKSAFSQDIGSDTAVSTEPPQKKPKCCSFSAPEPAFLTSQDETIDLTEEDNGIFAESFIPTADIHSINWIDNFTPKIVSELAVNPKKIQEVQEWLQNYECMRRKNPGQILLITGPAGSGKTTAVRMLAAECKYRIVEWVTPVDIEIVQRNERCNRLSDEEKSYKESQIDTFRRFLFQSSRYRSVFEELEQRLILVEDFPNVFIRNSEGFNEILEDYKIFGKSPLVFIATDSRSKSLNISYNLFSDSVKGEHQIVQISFNPISTTLMKKAMKRICALMTHELLARHYKPPSDETVESINLTSQGDIRNATINLHFASLNGAPKLSSEISESLSGSSCSKSKTKSTRKLKAIGRDETITMMHALGRVFNPKYIEDIADGHKKLSHSPEILTDGFLSEPRLFTAFIHSNYLQHFSDIDCVQFAANSLCISDIIINEYREDDLANVGLNIAIRGVMVANEKPLTGWMPVRGLKKIIKRDTDLQTERKRLKIENNITMKTFSTDYQSYVNIIIPK